MRLTEAERERRRRSRVRFSFSDESYAHYDTSEYGYGSADDWIAAAERLADGRGAFKAEPSRRRRRDANLDLLGLDEMPETIDGLKSAFRQKVMTAHPDHGGTAAAFKALYAAYERLVRMY